MVDKPNSVFEKLDEQGDKITDISEKLEGVSVNDLYALAKRTWDYGDYKTAQKYYNHISLLRPLEWEAPLYASLCNFHGYHSMFFWSKTLEQLTPIIVSTMVYINNLDLPGEEKEREFNKCVEIVKEEIKSIDEHYYKYKKEYDDLNPNYCMELQEAYLEIIRKTKDIAIDSIKTLDSFLAEKCLYNAVKTKQLSRKIDKDMLDYLKSIVINSSNVNYEDIMNLQTLENVHHALNGSKLTIEEKHSIMIKGKMYFEYNDKDLSKRKMIRRVVASLLIFACAIIGTVFSFIYYPLLAIVFVPSIPCGVLILISSVKDKNGHFCTSMLSFRIERNRLTSKNTIRRVGKPSALAILVAVSFIDSMFLGIFLLIMVSLPKDIGLMYKIIFWVCGVINAVGEYYIILTSGNLSSLEGSYKYLFNGEYYYFG